MVGSQGEPIGFYIVLWSNSLHVKAWFWITILLTVQFFPKLVVAGWDLRWCVLPLQILSVYLGFTLILKFLGVHTVREGSHVSSSPFIFFFQLRILLSFLLVHDLQCQFFRSCIWCPVLTNQKLKKDVDFGEIVLITITLSVCALHD
jgi:hypothetical protein